MYDSLYCNCDEETECLVANLFQHASKKLQVKVACSPKQKGGSDCGVYAIAFATVLVFEINPSKLRLN